MLDHKIMAMPFELTFYKVFNQNSIFKYQEQQ